MLNIQISLLLLKVLYPDNKAIEEYEQYKVIQDKNYVSNFDIFTSIENKLDKK